MNIKLCESLFHFWKAMQHIRQLQIAKYSMRDRYTGAPLVSSHSIVCRRSPCPLPSRLPLSWRLLGHPTARCSQGSLASLATTFTISTTSGSSTADSQRSKVLWKAKELNAAVCSTFLFPTNLKLPCTYMIVMYPWVSFGNTFLINPRSPNSHTHTHPIAIKATTNK